MFEYVDINHLYATWKTGDIKISNSNSGLPQESRSATKLERVLIVDDDALTREILRTHLVPVATHVDEAADGMAALVLFKQHRYDAVLLDNQMPGIDGCETVREIRIWENTQKLPQTLVLAITSSDFPGDEQRVLDAGATAYLVKPVKFRELMNALRCSHEVEESPHPMARLLPKFFPHVLEMLSEIESSKDQEFIANRLHQLRGMVAVYGFVEFSEHLKQIQTVVRQGEIPETTVFDKLRGELDILSKINKI